MWRFFAVAVLFSFGVHAGLLDDPWLNYGSEMQQKFFRAIGLRGDGRWQKFGSRNWYDDEYGVSDDKYEAKGVYLGYDDGYNGKATGVELRVNEDEVRDESNFIRPCDVSDWQCIRKFFAYNSQCSPAYGPSPDPLYLARSTLFFPFTNMTVLLTDVKITGLGRAKITDLYANKKTGNLVFAIEVQNLNRTSPKAFFTYRRTGKESIILADLSTVEYSSITFTAVIPKGSSGLRLDLADIHADVRDGMPKFFIGPNAFNSTDPDVITAVADFNLNLRAIIREEFLFQAQLLTAIYIQQNICNFGLKLYSV